MVYINILELELFVYRYVWKPDYGLCNWIIVIRVVCCVQASIPTVQLVLPWTLLIFLFPILNGNGDVF